MIKKIDGMDVYALSCELSEIKMVGYYET